MGKYIRKAKLTGEAAVMEVSAPVSIGVRTRARTLALQRLQKQSSVPDDDGSSSSCYLQLRSRRLEKSAVFVKSKVVPEPIFRSATPPSSITLNSPMEEKRRQPALEADAVVEVSFGENFSEDELRERKSRETTPCSMIRDSSIRTPGSTTRRPTSGTISSGRVENAMEGSIPISLEMEEFFAGPERLQQRSFTEKYNFDPVNDCPLPGRYEWVKLA
ncbi:Cyclin-dependent kinase inhibitor 3 [Apostasia shenzhenica]|uniref:Cyclin-dependent kinase inhibitor n=1 Tax=Apostasia shenzhenica TaxID=1088818 RepID=A0A2I0AF14_9ASPA|nr:Cyclin-dependent kinase inhibitor 3 [Apostasia shenzhenica]